ncbi:ribonuclease H protein [Aureococcus anophagefferens]|nr:ribonuclease H protein [Aureococcus anophagefferens]
MRAWIDDRGLTVVSGAGCSPTEAVTRRSGDHASEIDYVVVDAGRGVDVVSCATDGGDDGPLVDMYGGGPYTTDHRAIHTRLRVRVLETRRRPLFPAARPGSHEARRLHGIIQTEILGRAARGATHEWDAVRAADGSVVRDAAGVAARLSEWTAELHAERRNDPRYSESEYARLEREHADWERFERDRECGASLRYSALRARWESFERGADAGVVFGPAEWSAYLASCVRWSEVAAAIAASSSATSPSPADGICPPALKCGGMPLELALAAVFDVAMRTGAVPASWRTGYVRWLFKKGDELDPSCFRGIVLTSLLGLGGAALRLVALFENSVRVGTAGGGFTSPVARETGVPEGFVLAPSSLPSRSPVLAALEATGRGVALGGAWLGALLHDVAPRAVVRELQALAAALGLVLALPAAATEMRRQVASATGALATVGSMKRAHLLTAHAETGAFRFALGAASTGSHVAMATLLGEVTADVRLLRSGTVSADHAAAAAARSSRRARATTAPVARAVGRAAREYAERQAAGVSDLALFRAVRPSREWRRTWILEQRARATGGDRAVAILGGTPSRADAARPVGGPGRGRPGYCDLCGLYVRGTAADMAHVCLECPASRMARLTWMLPARVVRGAEDATPPGPRGGGALVARRSGAGALVVLRRRLRRLPGRVGRPRRPRGGLAELRDDLARAFASTFGEFFVAHASEIAALPPRRST